MSRSYATTRPVPHDADDLELYRTRASAVQHWFTELERHSLRPTSTPDAQLVDGEVVRVEGRVVIARAWLVWGPVEAHSAPDPVHPV